MTESTTINVTRAGKMYRADCPNCTRSWSMEAKSDRAVDAKSLLRDRVESHLPCERNTDS